ncbi:Carboxylesterase NlhH [Cupriavidus numazuensis]|uniref:Carboxylesterase NlhH n=2 Tax=Cupriavidus numazuensis TaxID=221992 RepID=A0ABN7Q1S5_9BURK|nr:Carboxylesterase NlhH [Cupriavidus numazuensis]
MSLDPEAQSFLSRLADAGQPRYDALSLADAREAMRAARRARPPMPPFAGSRYETRTGPTGVPLRLYRPAGMGPEPAAAILYLHGGGWALGELDHFDPLCESLAGQAGCIVVAADYRLAPEAKFPAAVNDACEAFAWMARSSVELGLDPTRLAVAGDSAGGNLAAVVALSARDGELPPVRLQVLLYPSVDMGMDWPSYAISEPGLPVDGRMLRWFREHYLRQPSDAMNWRASPLQAPKAGLAPAYVLTVGYDPLVDEGAAYAEAMREAGVEVIHHHYPGQFHGFLSVTPGSVAARRAWNEIGAAAKLFLSA